jgi:thiosulfate dehydrogenase (quinone) large subunit
MPTVDRPIAADTVIPDIEQTPRSRAFARSLAVARIATGWIFLWSFVDKLFGMGFATEREAAWINGGSPASGYLEFGTSGPLAGTFQAMAGSAVVDGLYMFAMLGMGLALILGIGLRVNAALGSVIVIMMWAGNLPPENNPFFTYHLLYAILFVVFALGAVGHTWGLGRRWEKLPIVQRHAWLK